MAHLRNDDINFDKLETGVHNAMKADDLYWLQNDAKFRAVKQQGSYDDFKDIVAAAHLKPLDKGEKLQFEDKIVSPWNVAANSQPDVKLEQTSEQPQVFTVPKTSSEFTLLWRKQKSAQDKSELVDQIIRSENGGPETLKTIFRNEIPFGLLGEFVKVLNLESDCYDKQLIYDTLKCLSETGRFSMSLMFLTEDEKHALQDLLCYLDSNDIDCAHLKSIYK